MVGLITSVMDVNGQSNELVSHHYSDDQND